MQNDESVKQDWEVAKYRVLAVYPDARAIQNFVCNWNIITGDFEFARMLTLSRCKSDAAAWLDAASRLPVEPSSSGDKASPVADGIDWSKDGSEGFDETVVRAAESPVFIEVMNRVWTVYTLYPYSTLAQGSSRQSAWQSARNGYGPVQAFERQRNPAYASPSNSSSSSQPSAGTNSPDGAIPQRPKKITMWTDGEDYKAYIAGDAEVYMDAQDARIAAQDAELARLRKKAEPAKGAEGAFDLLRELRAEGWMVAVHNDYVLNSAAYTFWLFTHASSGRFVKGEGVTDLVALRAAWNASRASQQSNGKGSGE